MSSSRILVDMVVRSDAAWKPGGDSVQIDEYESTLHAAGVDVRRVPFHPAMRLRRGSIVHVFNIDRPYEFIAAARRARRRRLVVSPIHHNVHRVRSMRAADSGRGLVSLSARVLPEALREWAATVVRALRTSRSPHDVLLTVGTATLAVPTMSAVWRATAPALERADGVALLAAGEGEDLAELTGWSRHNAVMVPNGRPEDLPGVTPSPWTNRPVGSIVVLGRIEPRKRQLEVAQAADRLGVKVTFAGARANEGDAYTAAFDDLASRSSFVEYAGVLARAQVLELLGRTRVLLNASWVEVQSLVDLEAATLGCAVVASGAGHSREWLGDAVHEVGSGDPIDLLQEASRTAAESTREVGDPGYDWTWRRSAEQLLEIYREGPVIRP